MKIRSPNRWGRPITSRSQPFSTTTSSGMSDSMIGRHRDDKRPGPPVAPPTGMGTPRESTGWFKQWYLLLLAVPLAAGLKLAGAGGVWVFLGAGLAIIPLAGLHGQGDRGPGRPAGPAVGGLLNATFGNAAELIIALFILARGPDLTRSSRRPSPGRSSATCCWCSGCRSSPAGAPVRGRSSTARGRRRGTTLLAIACAGLLVPTLFLLPVPPPAAGLRRGAGDREPERGDRRHPDRRCTG